MAFEALNHTMRGKTRRRRASTVIASIALAACAGSVTPAPRPVPETGPIEDIAVAPFGVPGETMVFDARFRGVLVARVTVAVGEPGDLDGLEQIAVVARIESDGLLAIVREAHYQLTTWIDLASGYPTRSVSEYEGTVKGKRETGGHTRTWRPSERRHNAVSALGVLRNWDPRAGTRGRARVWIGLTFDVTIATTGREMRDGRPAVRYAGYTQWNRRFDFAAWISDDRYRVPLRIEAETKWGLVELDLIGYSDGS